MHLLRVISGGQTGVDRGALDAALAAGCKVGGWCPAGRRAEDGRIPPRYPLRESNSPEPAERTRLNVREADATLVLCPGPLAGGTRLAAEVAAALGRPLLVLDPGADGSLDRAVGWMRATGTRTLNVAGPREGEWPGAYDAARGFIAGLVVELSGSPRGGQT